MSNDVFNLEEAVLFRKDISESVIKTLSSQLHKEDNVQVKEVIVAAIGGIGLPEAKPCID